MNDAGFIAEAYIEENIRKGVRQVAARLRRVAEDLERAAEHEKVETLPETVASTVSWGVANANLARPAADLRELYVHRQIMQQEAK